MARMPGAEYRPVVSGNYPKMTRYDVLCFHTIVGYAEGGSAAHWTTDAEGHIIQWRDTIFRSAANADGNHRVLAVENEDRGPAFGQWGGSDVPAFTPAQVEALAHICVWAYQTHGIPLVACPDSKPGSRGIAFHRQGIPGAYAPYNGIVPGGEVWSSARGKACPGDRRIAQVPQIITRARVLAGLDNAPQEDDFMVKFVQGDHPVWGKHVFKVEYAHDGGEIAVRTHVPNQNEPGYRLFLALGGKVERVAQAMLDAIPYKDAAA